MLSNITILEQTFGVIANMQYGDVMSWPMEKPEVTQIEEEEYTTKDELTQDLVYLWEALVNSVETWTS